MVWENNSRQILMMCETIEGNRSKCAQYWPKVSSKKNYEPLIISNNLSVQTISEIEIDEYLTQRYFILENALKNEKRQITQLHFRNWPDHGVPKIESAFEAFEIINNMLDEHFEIYKKTSPVIVHCSAGVGRTGTAIAIYILNFIYIQFFLKMKKKKIIFNIFNIVRQLKEQRICMVQTKSQYEMIYLYFEIFIRKILENK